MAQHDEGAVPPRAQPRDAEPSSSAWAPPPRRDTAPPATTVPADFLPGYTGFTLLATGGDSVVYRAHQPALQRDVAVKVVDISDPSTLARFQRELELTVRLGRQHPHIVTVLDTGTTSDGRPCIVMEMHDLGSLHDRLVQLGPLTTAEVVHVGTVVADALDFAHGQGVLHRDVKPQNVLVLPTSYVLTDFGIARMADAGHTASLERFSYRHASPQVLDGQPPTAADDVWSLGSTLFTLLDGRPPFASDDPSDDTALGYLRRVRTATPRRLQRTDVPPELAAVVLRCLEPERSARFAGAAALRTALRAVPTEVAGWDPTAPVVADPSPVATAAPANDAAPADDAAPVDRPAVDPPVADPPAPVDRAWAPPAEQAPVAGTPAAALDPWAPRPAGPPAAALSAPAPAPVAARAPAAAPAAPVPVAASALSHVPLPPPRAAERDVDDTGFPLPATETETAEGEPRPRGLRIFAAATVAALLVGITVAVLVQVNTAGPGQAQVVATTTTRQTDVPTATVVPTVGPTPEINLGNPAIAPQDLVVVHEGTSVVLTWTDPTEGAATFAFSEVVGDVARAFGQAEPGSTSFTWVQTDLPGRTVCVFVTAVVDLDNFGATDEQCVSPPPS